MADLSAIPGELNLALYRGDSRSATLTITDDAGDPLVLPTTGWTAQVRADRTSAATLADYPVLMTFTVDSSAGASGVIVIAWDGDDLDALPKSTKWDLQSGTEERTYLAGKLTVSDQVTR
jgi:hypothetical protein